MLPGAAQSTDIMQSFKTGHLLRASPRAQFLASLYGCVVGVWASVAGLFLEDSSFLHIRLFASFISGFTSHAGYSRGVVPTLLLSSPYSRLVSVQGSDTAVCPAVLRGTCLLSLRFCTCKSHNSHGTNLVHASSACLAQSNAFPAQAARMWYTAAMVSRFTFPAFEAHSVVRSSRFTACTL